MRLKVVLKVLKPTCELRRGRGLVRRAVARRNVRGRAPPSRPPCPIRIRPSRSRRDTVRRRRYFHNSVSLYVDTHALTNIGTTLSRGREKRAESYSHHSFVAMSTGDGPRDVAAGSDVAPGAWVGEAAPGAYPGGVAAGGEHRDELNAAFKANWRRRRGRGGGVGCGGCEPSAAAAGGTQHAAGA